MTDQGVAPSALRMPISFVRSFTAIIMMFETPTTPARSVPTPITQTNAPDPAHQVDEPLELDDGVRDEDGALVVGVEVVPLGDPERAGPSAIAWLSSTVASPTVIMIIATRFAPPKVRWAVEIGR